MSDLRPTNKQYILDDGYDAIDDCAQCVMTGTKCIFLLRSDPKGNKLVKCAKCTRHSRPCTINGLSVTHILKKDNQKDFATTNVADATAIITSTTTATTDAATTATVTDPKSELAKLINDRTIPLRIFTKLADAFHDWENMEN